METEFKIHLKGISLPDDVKADISRALNNTFMEKLGQLNLHKKTTKFEDKSNTLSSYWANQIYINGGRIMERIQSQSLQEFLKTPNTQEIPIGIVLS